MSNLLASRRGVTCVETSLLLVSVCMVALFAVARIGTTGTKSFYIVANEMGGGSLGTHDGDDPPICTSPAACTLRRKEK